MSPEKQPPDSLPPDAQPPDTQSGAEMRALIADLRPRNADLLEALHRVEGRYGYVSPQALRLIGEQLRLSAAHVYGAASFYSELRTTPPPARTVAWCSGVACLLKNSGGILRALEAVLGCRLGSQREDGRVGLVRGQCNGTCELAPQLRLDGTVIGRLTAARAVTLARALLEDAPPPPGAPPGAAADNTPDNTPDNDDGAAALMGAIGDRFATLRDRARAVHAAWERPPWPRIDVAVDSSSLAAGAGAVSEALEREARRRDADVDFGRVVGGGMQWLQPLVDICWPDGARVLYGPLRAEHAGALLEEAGGRMGAAAELAIGTLAGSRPGIPPVAEHPFFAPERGRRLLARVGLSDPESLEHYIAGGGYAALARMLDRDQSPEAVRQLVIDAGLTGRGGAYFPAGVKWNFLAGAGEVRRTLICNADEGDPGAWVNRVLLEGDPQAVIEGMLIAAFATGANHGYLYVRDEYPLAVERMRRAIARAQVRGLVGEQILGSAFSCTLEVIRGAGAYVCGEETGLIASLQDERGMPRIKPPFPANPGGGVFGEASNVNNVETYASVPLILRHGAEWYRERGTEGAAGSKLFSLSGDVERVGFMELPWGTPLRAVLEACGGVSGGAELKAIQAGGPLAGYLPGELLEALTLEPGSFAPHGALVGSGGLVFVGAGSCSVELNAAFADFLEDESCGRCSTCHGGNQRMTEIFRRVAAGGGRVEDRRGLELLGEALQYSNCVHGSASPTVMRNTLRFFEAEYEAHISGDGCGTLRCDGLTRFRVVDASDPALAEARAICPTGAIVPAGDNTPAGNGEPAGAGSSQRGAGGYRVLDAACIRCGACAELAPRGIAREPAPPAALQR